ncbi:GAF and ANTAR domain-containing protein [Actinocrinis sp.]|uniref:GAF and ANTAR domain-containing protein n=1 Tax=Actinocrinis sp. TaxID=1920516 RepID=UPI002D420688|nr:GAF and ANTAR domain-containing protein [Actinocrinis sp.]HZP51310.1 GAF and ANTAR domain-containing protein [Actinocrinis sp.]
MVGRAQAVHDLLVTLADSVGVESQQQNLPQLLADGAAGVAKTDATVLLDEAGTLAVAAAHGTEAADLAATEVESGQGPSVDCFRDGAPVSCTDLLDQALLWPLWAGQARAAGFTAVHVRPLRRRQYRIGVLILLANEASPQLTHRQLATVQALADAATVGLLHQRLLRRQALVTAQLRFALDSRILIEQAKGVLSERTGSTVDQAFQLLREYARSHGRKIHEVAADVIGDSLRLPDRAADRPQPPAK